MADLFTPDMAPRFRKPRQKLMHVVDAGAEGWVEMECGHCGYKSGWHQRTETVTELKRGVPCEKCNEVKNG